MKDVSHMRTEVEQVSRPRTGAEWFVTFDALRSLHRFGHSTFLSLRLLVVVTIVACVGCGGDSNPPPLSGPGKTKGSKATDPIAVQAPDPSGLKVLDELGVSDLRVPRATLTAKKNTSESSTADSGKEKSKGNSKRPDTWIDAGELPYEFWEIQFIGNRPIGYIHQRIAPSLVGSAGIYRIDVESFKQVQSQGKQLDQHVKVMTIEDSDGSLRTIEAVMKQGDIETKVEGNVVLGTLRLQIITDGAATGKDIPWTDDELIGGPFADMQSLRGRPMKPGEERRFSWLDPITGEILQMELIAKDFIKTPLLDGLQYRLLEVTARAYLGDRGVTSTLWVNEKGETLKSYNASTDIRSYRCERSLAEKVRDGAACEAIDQYSVPLKQPIKDATTAPRLTFVMNANERFPTAMFPSTTSQRVKISSSVTNEITVYPMKEHTPLPSGVSPELRIDETFTAATPVLQTKDAFVNKLSKQFLESGPQGKSSLERLRIGVFKWITNKVVFSPEMASAAEVARSQTGDSTEHAMLLAAVVRARGVPSRVASGLVYNRSDEDPAMVYRAWTEVYLRDHWVSVDASVEEEGTDATYIKFLDSGLADHNPYPIMLPVLHLLPSIELSLKKPERESPN